MKIGNEKTPSWGRMIRSVVLGAAVSALICTLILVIMAALMTKIIVPAMAVTPIALAAAAIGAVVGGWVSARLSRERGLLCGAASGLLLFLLITAAGFVFLPQAGGTLLLAKVALMVGGGALGGVLGVNTKRRH